MLADIVVDTNVLVHADNLTEPRQSSCCELISEMMNCATHLCVDEGFDVSETNNRSVIGCEYLKHLRFGMVGYELVRHLALSLRVKQVSKNVPRNVSRHIVTQVPKGPDRVFIKVAFNSKSKTLVCHDFGDVPETVRGRLKKFVNLQIVDADGGVAVLR